MHFDGSAIDGPFQFYNAMRRIQGGFRPGIDFQFFHGLGIPYTHYWLYRLFGEGLRGAELARQLVAVTVYFAVYLVAFRGFLGNWTKALCATVIATAAAYAMRLAAVVFAMNGMLGLRAALPTALPGLLLLVRNDRRRAMVAGPAMGFALWMSTEQGLAFALAYVVISAVAAIGRSAWRAKLVETAGAAGLAIVTLVLLETAVAGPSGMRGAIAYNFRIVPANQYWYYGAPPNQFIGSWLGLFRSLLTNPTFAIAVLGSLAAVGFSLRAMWHATDDETRRRDELLAVAGAYALISCGSLLGVFTGVYDQPARRVLLIIAIVALARCIERIEARRGIAPVLGVPRSMALGGTAVVAYALIAVPFVRSIIGIGAGHTMQAHVVSRTQFAAGGIWPETLADAQRIVDAHRAPDGSPPTIWSTYAGWIEARNGVFNPSFDYIIHPLGAENRRAYLERFTAAKPALVQTVRPSYTQYESWIEDNHWDLYDVLLRDYRIAGSTPWSFFWERRATPLPAPSVAASLTIEPGSQGASFRVPDALPDPTLIDVEIGYTTHNPLHALPIVGMTPRYLLQIGGAIQKDPISLPPYDTVKTFPLLVRGGSTVSFRSGTFGLLPGASWQARWIRIRPRGIDPADSVWVKELAARNSRSGS